MSLVIDYLRHKDEDGKRYAADILTMRCDGCGTSSPRDCMQVGTGHWERATIRYAVQRHGWTERLERNVLRDFCAKCSAPTGTQLAIDGVSP